MSDHIPDAGDPDATPIMDAVDVKCDELNVMDAICYAVYEGQKLEIQLNEANARIKRLEGELMDVKNKHSVLVADVVLNEDRAERIKRLEDRIRRASIAFFEEGSDASVASGMLAILEEERRKQ